MKKTAKRVMKLGKSITDKMLPKSNKIAGRTILLVNTGSVKKKFILQRLSRIGVKLVILNKEKNWAEPYADKWILADTSNHSEAIRAVRDFMNKER